MEGEVFDCSKCNKVFKNSLGLAMHKATYHEQKNYICEICSQPYKYRRGLSRHYTRNHANNHKRFIGHQSGNEIEVNDAINDINNIEKEDEEQEQEQGEGNIKNANSHIPKNPIIIADMRICNRIKEEHDWVMRDTSNIFTSIRKK